MRKNIIFILAACILLSGCGLYKKYEQNVETPTDIYGATGYITAPVDSTSLAQLSWREFFTDPLLQNLIDRVLANNTDLNSARLAVEISEESLKTAKAAYLPAISFAPSGTLSSFDFGAVGKTYSVPLQLNMDVELFGGITNKKRAANAALLQSQMREEAVRANLISTVAQQYFCCRCSTANWQF
ncbi:MAG: TolC family protein [Muribaculaceae bacterium]|nr:TolC family protein [Muribaculaceae bacterium]